MPRSKSEIEAPDVGPILRACPLVSGAAPDTLRVLVARSKPAWSKKGESLWREGEQARSFVLVLTGMLRMTKLSPQGKPITVELLGASDAAGILATHTGTAYPLTAVPVTDLWCLRVPNMVWHQALDSDPALRDRVIHHLSERWLDGLTLMASMMACRVDSRLAISLLHALDLERRTDPGADLVHLTRQSLADIASTTVESAIRVTSKWQKLGWIKAEHRSLHVLDEDALAMASRQP